MGSLRCFSLDGLAELAFLTHFGRVELSCTETEQITGLQLWIVLAEAPTLLDAAASERIAERPDADGANC